MKSTRVVQETNPSTSKTALCEKSTPNLLVGGERGQLTTPMTTGEDGRLGSRYENRGGMVLTIVG